MAQRRVIFEDVDSGLSIALVGAGNVASHLAGALAPSLAGIFNRSASGASALAAATGTKAFTGYDMLGEVRPDVIIISVADNALRAVAEAIGRLEYNPLVIHTSGTVPMEALDGISPRYGILYPLQTFSKSVPVDMSRVPFFTEAADPADHLLIDSIAASISTAVYHADGAHRMALHMAGVFTSNFTNILLESVQRILEPAGYGLEVVRPLLEATVDKAFAVGPHAAQTGPARRGDFAVMRKHLENLPEDLRPAYKVLSELILKTHNIDE